MDISNSAVERLDQRNGVGSRHHVVPRFLLRRWADSNDQVQVYSRVDGRFTTRNIQDLAIKDFYTFIDTDQEKNSLVESILSSLESDAAVAIGQLLDPIRRHSLADIDIAAIDMLLAFQIVRTPRHRREQQIQAEWYAKSLLSGKVADEDLSKVKMTPHQNELLSMLGPAVDGILPFIFPRRLTVLTLDRPSLLTGDEPVLMNSRMDDAHIPDCFLTDAEMQKRFDRERRKKARLRRNVSRVIHMSPTVPRGVAKALKIVMPISPRIALLWGKPNSDARAKSVDRQVLTAAESQSFARTVNQATMNQALDWVISTMSDLDFSQHVFPPLGPLMHVCDGTNAASLSVNSLPDPVRPRRLWTDI